METAHEKLQAGRDGKMRGGGRAHVGRVGWQSLTPADMTAETDGAYGM